MPSNAILHEALQLHNVSDRLDVLAEEHPVVSEALITISGSVRNTATLLQVLVATRMGLLPGQIQQMPDWLITVRKLLFIGGGALVVQNNIQE